MLGVPELQVHDVRGPDVRHIVVVEEDVGDTGDKKEDTCADHRQCRTYVGPLCRLGRGGLEGMQCNGLKELEKQRR